jgi:hypothetical protein
MLQRLASLQRGQPFKPNILFIHLARTSHEPCENKTPSREHDFTQWLTQPEKALDNYHFDIP